MFGDFPVTAGLSGDTATAELVDYQAMLKSAEIFKILRPNTGRVRLPPEEEAAPRNVERAAIRVFP